MKKSRFTEEQIIGFIKQAEAGMPIKELCRKGTFGTSPELWGGLQLQYDLHQASKIRRPKIDKPLRHPKQPITLSPRNSATPPSSSPLRCRSPSACCLSAIRCDAAPSDRRARAVRRPRLR